MGAVRLKADWNTFYHKTGTHVATTERRKQIFVKTSQREIMPLEATID
jgi:hypothetical protein